MRLHLILNLRRTRKKLSILSIGLYLRKTMNNYKPQYIFRGLYEDRRLVVRPLAMFLDTVNRDGLVRPRFRYVAETEVAALASIQFDIDPCHQTPPMPKSSTATPTLPSFSALVDGSKAPKQKVSVGVASCIHFGTQVLVGQRLGSHGNGTCIVMTCTHAEMHTCILRQIDTFMH